MLGAARIPLYRRCPRVASRQLQTYASHCPLILHRLMVTVLDEVTTMSIDAPYVQRRVDDWIRRLNSLYGELNASLPGGWSTESATVTMHEIIMRKFNVPPAILPALLFAHETGATASLEPGELWVIGANGRLYLTAGGQRYIVHDTADSFAPPAWEVCPAHDRWNREPFTPDWLRRILR